jgi:hypothetical protein
VIETSNQCINTTNDNKKGNRNSKIPTDLNSWLRNLAVSHKALSMPTLHCTCSRIPPRPTWAWSLINSGLQKKFIISTLSLLFILPEITSGLDKRLYSLRVLVNTHTHLHLSAWPVMDVISSTVGYSIGFSFPLFLKVSIIIKDIWRIWDTSQWLMSNLDVVANCQFQRNYFKCIITSFSFLGIRWRL